MEAAKEDAGFLDKLIPPRLEDAGLEDCALPPDSIKEAFLKAATLVGSRATSIFHSEEEDDGLDGAGECVHDPWPGEKSAPPSDTVVGIEKGEEDPGPCSAKKGGAVVEEDGLGGDLVVGGGEEGKDDEIVIVGEGRVGRLGEGEDGACVDGMRGLNIGKKEKDREGGGEDERPTLVEGYGGLV